MRPSAVRFEAASPRPLAPDAQLLPLMVTFPVTGMPKPSSSLSALLLLSAVSFAQETPGPRHGVLPENSATQRFLLQSHPSLRALRAHGGAWTAHFDEKSGAPRLVTGSGLDTGTRPIATIGEARVVADRLLAELADVWGVPLSSLSFLRADKAGPIYLFSWQQQFQGLDVFGATVQLQIHEAGRLAALSNTTVAIPEGFTRSPKLTPAQAAAAVAANKLLATGDSVDAVDFVVFPKAENRTATPKLAFEVVVEQSSQEVFEIVFVDANDGSILEVRPGRYHFDVKGKVTGTANSALSGLAAPVPGVPLPGVTVSVAGVGSAITDENGDYTVVTAQPGPFSVTATLNGPTFDVINNGGTDLIASATSTPSGGFQVADLAFNTVPSEFGTAQTTAAYHHDVVFDWVQSKLPTYGGFAAQGTNVNVNSTCNASFNPSTNAMNFYRAGGSCSNTAFSTIIYHEFGHGVDDYFTGIDDGGLSEGYGDVVAMYLTGQALVGTGFSTSGSGIRTGENNVSWPASGCGGEEHCLGETWMGYAWQLRKKLVISMGATAGPLQAETVVLGTFLVNNLSIPAAVTQTFILDDNDGNLSNGTPHYSDLAAAAAQKGFTAPEVVTMTASHVPYPDTFNQTQPYVIEVTVAPVGSVTVSSVMLDWKIDTGLLYFPVAMTPTGEPNRYRAEIPPIVAPAVVYYRFRATDSSANVLTVPKGDDSYKFAIGKRSNLFIDNLESGAPGWVHAQVSQQDDWNLGDPQTLGTNQYDPLTPYSGVRCWGNDLQVTSVQQNGLYQQNATNYLETPNINASGKTGVRLRYRRWLTIEASQFDIGTITVNGSQVYKNPTGADLIDDEWTLQDHPMSMANNNAAFKVRWTLDADGGLQYGGWTLDDVEVYALEATPVLNLNITPSSTTPLIGNILTFSFNGTPGAGWELYVSTGNGPEPLPGIGMVSLDLANAAFFAAAVMPGSGTDALNLPIPFEPALIGLTLYWQGAATMAGALPQISNGFQTTFQ